MIKCSPLYQAIELIVLVLLVSCNVPSSTQTADPQDPTLEPSIETTPAPTPTEVIIYVATVNGEGIRQSSFESSLMQFKAAQAEFGNLLEDGDRAEDRVMEALIYRGLLAQEARATGFILDDGMVDARLIQLTEQAGGPEALTTWMENNGYTLETFRVDLTLEIEAAWQREQIASSVPETTEQVKARQIFFYDSYLAARAYSQLNAGTPFEIIAENNDPKNLGYLDWFPRGYLFYPVLEEIAFSLQPGQFSEIIETELGYHILQVLEYDPNHPLSADARLTLQTRLLQDWLANRYGQSQIDIFLP